MLTWKKAGPLVDAHTSVSDEICRETDFCKALCVIHHSWTAANVSQHENGHRPEGVLIARLQNSPCFVQKPGQGQHKCCS
jgi:hypothetical protein